MLLTIFFNVFIEVILSLRHSNVSKHCCCQAWHLLIIHRKDLGESFEIIKDKSMATMGSASYKQLCVVCLLYCCCLNPPPREDEYFSVKQLERMKWKQGNYQHCMQASESAFVMVNFFVVFVCFFDDPHCNYPD